MENLGTSFDPNAHLLVNPFNQTNDLNFLGLPTHELLATPPLLPSNSVLLDLTNLQPQSHLAGGIFPTSIPDTLTPTAKTATELGIFPSTETSSPTLSFLNRVVSDSPLAANWQYPLPTFNFPTQRNSTFDAGTIERIKATAVTLWQQLLPNGQQLDVDIQFTHLTNGQIAQAELNKFSATGMPIGGRILLDPDAQGAGWFIDPTPTEHSEFTTPLNSTAFLATSDSPAAGKYDLFSTLLHEMGHIAGFIDGNPGLEKFAQATGVALTADGSHLDSSLHPYDLMNATLQPGERLLPSDLDIKTVTAARAKLETIGLGTVEHPLTASLKAAPPLANGDFSIDTPTNANYGWQTSGAARITNGTAILADNSNQLANLKQTFTIPPGAKKLQFRIQDSQFKIDPSSQAPQDAFEVALLDANTLKPLLGTAQGLANTDSLLNIQADGTTYFSDKVQIAGLTTSGSKMSTISGRTITIDVSQLATDTQATLYFDLLGFGAKDSSITIDDVKFFTTSQPAPIASDTTATTNQATPVTITLPTTASSIEIATNPAHGNVKVNSDNTITYTPTASYAGTDSLIYTTIGSDGQVSNLAKITLTVNSIAPSVTDIIIPATISEGQTVTLTGNVIENGTIQSSKFTVRDLATDITTVIDGKTIDYKFVDNGNYEITYTATDSYGGVGSKTIAVSVANVAPTIANVTVPAQINEGETAAFTATATDPGAKDQLTYSWNFGDNTDPVIGQNVNHIFGDNGNYNVILTVTDQDGGIAHQTTTVKVNNVAPTIVNITKPQTIKEGQAVTFSAIANDPGVKDTLTYSWNFGDSTAPVIGQNATHIFADNGDYNAILTVTDKDGIATTKTVLATVENVAPSIVTITKPDAIKTGRAVTFTATATDPGINDTLTYSWNFGDNSSTISSQNPSHTFNSAGTYNVTLTVTDKDGAITTETITTSVTNSAPTISSLTPPGSIDEGKSAAFTATATNGSNDSLIYTWNFGDNSNPVIGQNSAHIFANNGTYNVTLTVANTDGEATTQTVAVKVDNVAPTIVSISKPDQINEGQAVEFKAIATDPGILSTLIYTWNFGDNTLPVIGQNATHTFADNGNYDVILIVTDKDGGVTTQTVAVKVDNVAPTIVSISKPDQINEGQAVEFKAIATDPGILSTLIYTWNFGDNTLPVIGQNATHTFADNGNYDVILTVTDKDGGVTTQTVAVKVDNVAPTIVSIFKPDRIIEGQAAEFRAIATDPGSSKTLSYSWNFGDSTNPVIGKEAIHTFADNRDYNVVLTVMDKDGATTSQTIVATVDNVAPSIVNIIKPDKINEGQAVEFKAIANDPGILDTLTYSWNFGDATNPIVGKDATHTFADNGDYSIVLTVTDKDGGITSQTVAVKVDNVAPSIVNIIKPDKINEGQAVEFKATANDPGVKDTLTYSWNFGDATNSIVGKDVTHTFADNGTHNVVLTVTDKDGGVTSQTTVVKVDNVAPSIVSILKPAQINEGQAVEFKATANDPGVLDTLTYSWNFGDATSAIVGKDVTHTFADNGIYNVVLTVADKDGGVSTQTTVVKVDNVAPSIVSIVKPAQISEGETVKFTATANDPGVLDALTYSWNFGDGTNPVITDTATHIFADNGNYNVTLTATDNDSAATTQTVAVKVDNVTPTIVNIVKPDRINEGQPGTFSATATDPGIKDTLIYTWNFGDNTNPVNGQNITHTFTDNGSYNVVLTVTDKDGGTTQQTTQIKVDNVAPIVEPISGKTTSQQGETLDFGVKYTDPGINDTHTIVWNFDDGSSLVSNTTTPTHTFTKSGIHNVTVTVTDNDGASTSDSHQITVANVPPTINPLTVPTNINQGQPLRLTATATDPGNDPLTYRWYINNSTIPVIGQSINYTFATTGIYPVKIEVLDTDGGISTQTVDITVKNVAPTINSIFIPTKIDEGDTVRLMATASDPGNDPLTYQWYINNATTPILGQLIDYTFPDNGNYDVVLTVMDKDGATTSQGLIVKVNNVAPTIATITKPDLINEGQVVAFTAIATDPGILDTLTYSWNFGDATNPIIGKDVTHTFVDNGTYNVVLTVTDKDGGVTSQTTAVKVDNVAPSIVNILKPDKINEGQAVEFKATANDPGILDTLTYSWNFGDDTNPIIGKDVTHTFADNGTYNVVLTVTDKDGGVTSQTTAVKVDNVAPSIVNIIKPTTIKEGEQVTFTATVNDPGIKDTLTYSWNFGDGTGLVVDKDATHTFIDNGDYNVILTVTDKDGGVTSQTTAVKVDNVAPSIVNIIKPTTIKEGEPVTFTTTVTDPGIKDTLTYSWNFGDATNPIAGKDVTHTFADNGTYDVVLTVTDKDGGVTSQTTTVKVDNVAPLIVNIIKPTTIKEGEQVTFTATVNDPGIKDTLTYSWNFGDGTASVIDKDATHTFTDNGDYNVILTVTDKDGGVTSQTVAVKVENMAPSIINIVKPPTIKEGESVIFTATANDPGIKDTLTYSWNFGDGTELAIDKDATHTFTDNGDYNVVLTVTDKDGGVASQTVAVKVENVAPSIVNIIKPTTIKEGEPVTFTTTVTDPGIKDTLTYSWNFGDATNPIAGKDVTHTFADNGTYDVVLTVTDKDGGVTSQTTTVKVDNVAPLIVSILKPDKINEGQSVEFKATANDPGSLDTLIYNWNFGDATNLIVGKDVTHTFADNGTYDVVLTVTDKDGGVTSQTVAIKVDNVAPSIVNIVKPSTIKEGEPVTFTATVNDPGIKDTLTYSWNFGDGTGLVSDEDATHTFVDNGDYSVVLTVTDKDGGVTSQTVAVKVDNVAPSIVSIIKPDKINEGQIVTFSSNTTDPGILETLMYVWNFGDSTIPVTGKTAIHAFADNGNYNVALTVTDKDGATTTQTVLTNVDNVAPTIISIAKPDKINEGQAVTFSATATDPGIQDTLTYSWNFGDKTPQSLGQDVTHTFTDNGTYDVILTVTDKDAAFTTQTTKTTVELRPTPTPTTPQVTQPGTFTVDASGQVTIDYLFDGGDYRGQMAVFSLDGMENLTVGSDEYIRTAAARVLSNQLGYLAIDDNTETGRYNNAVSTNPYHQAKTFKFKPGTKVALMLMSQGGVEQLLNYNQVHCNVERPFFSFDTEQHLADLTGKGQVFGWEDLALAHSDRDYNDIVFQIGGATGNIALPSPVSGATVINAILQQWREHRTNAGNSLQFNLEHQSIKAQVTNNQSTQLAIDIPNICLTYRWYIDNATVPLVGSQIDYTFKQQGTYSLRIEAASGDGSIVSSTLAQVSSVDVHPGVFTVGDGGEVKFDYLFDGGDYRDQMAVFSLAGMEQMSVGSDEYIQMAMSRAMSNSTQGYLVLDDARQTGDYNPNAVGAKLAPQVFKFAPGTQVALMLLPDGDLQRPRKRPLFSHQTQGQMVDLTGKGSVFGWEDLTLADSDRDYNDVVFEVEGFKSKL